MFCFPRTPQKKRSRYKESRTVIYSEFPRDPVLYLPHLCEHQVQTEAEVIDDPSSIFFDPSEKAGFVYTATSSYSNNFDYSQYLKEQKDTTPVKQHHQIVVDTKQQCSLVKVQQRSPISSDYDDSLDLTQSDPNTPSIKGDNVFNRQFTSTRKDSLEFDDEMIPSSTTAMLNHSFGDDEFSRILSGSQQNDTATTPGSVSQCNDNLQSLVDDYTDLHLYEEELLFECQLTGKNKGYQSESESIKTYQDSGIYDDDVFSTESPKPLTAEELENVRQELYGNNSDTEENSTGGGRRDIRIERFSAFKTPNSSRHTSLESLNEQPPKTPTKINNDSHIRKNNKYSHIPAKVQCHRRGERSPSPGGPLRKKSPMQSNPPSYKHMVFGKPTSLSTSTTKATINLKDIKPKVDSLSNIHYTPGGGSSKVFTEKLSFRAHAEPRTDTHGIEMYAHLPEEFQEIARRLARQDSQLKKQNEARGRSRSRSSSFIASSRQSSVSPQRGRSRTRRKITPGNSISDIFSEVNANKTPTTPGSPTKPRPSLSRSSSIRSIPNTPHLCKQHPASALRKSPSASPHRNNHGVSNTSTTVNITENKTSVNSSSPFRSTTDQKESRKTSRQSKTERMPSPVMKLYQFTTQNESFGSPNTSSIFQSPVL